MFNTSLDHTPERNSDSVIIHMAYNANISM